MHQHRSPNSNLKQIVCLLPRFSNHLNSFFSKFKRLLFTRREICFLFSVIVTKRIKKNYDWSIRFNLIRLIGQLIKGRQTLASNFSNSLLNSSSSFRLAVFLTKCPLNDAWILIAASHSSEIRKQKNFLSRKKVSTFIWIVINIIEKF